MSANDYENTIHEFDFNYTIVLTLNWLFFLQYGTNNSLLHRLVS